MSNSAWLLRVNMLPPVYCNAHHYKLYECKFSIPFDTYLEHIHDESFVLMALSITLLYSTIMLARIVHDMCTFGMHCEHMQPHPPPHMYRCEPS